MICDATLIFQLSTARSALPVQGASVLVTDPITGRNTRLTTDQSGRTRVLCVTAPPLSWSQSPGNDGRPYSIYHADIRAEGYVPMRLTGIQVFAGQQSLQMVEMVPCEGGEEHDQYAGGDHWGAGGPAEKRAARPLCPKPAGG